MASRPSFVFNNSIAIIILSSPVALQTALFVAAVIDELSPEDAMIRQQFLLDKQDIFINVIPFPTMLHKLSKWHLYPGCVYAVIISVTISNMMTVKSNKHLTNRDRVNFDSDKTYLHTHKVEHQYKNGGNTKYFIQNKEKRFEPPVK